MAFIDTATLAFNFISGMGITHIVDSAVASLVPKSSSKITNLCTHVGCFVIGTMLSDAACQYVNNTITDIRNNVHIVVTSAAKDPEYIEKETNDSEKED